MRLPERKVLDTNPGVNIYFDEEGQKIFYDVVGKKGYFVRPKTDRLLSLYQFRHMLALCCAILGWFFLQSVMTGALIGLGMAVVMGLLFRLTYLPRCTVVEGFVPPKRESMGTQIRNKITKREMITRGLIFIAVGVLLVINSIQQDYAGMRLFLSYGGCVVAVAIGGYYIFLSFSRE